jgi:formylglycine-generating enzyme required for sulfatase activity
MTRAVKTAEVALEIAPRSASRDGGDDCACSRIVPDAQFDKPEVRNPHAIEVLMSVVDTDSSSARPQQHTDILVVPRGTFRVGSDRPYPEEAPVDWKRLFAFEGK